MESGSRPSSFILQDWQINNCRFVAFRSAKAASFAERKATLYPRRSLVPTICRTSLSQPARCWAYSAANAALPAAPWISYETTCGLPASITSGVPSLSRVPCLHGRVSMPSPSAVDLAHGLPDFSGIGIGRRLLFVGLRGVRRGSRAEHPRHSDRQRDLRSAGSNVVHQSRATP